MACHCFLAGCHLCFPDTACACFLPTCAWCCRNAANSDSLDRLVHSGKALNEDLLKVIAKVDMEVSQLLEEGVLARGPAWENLPSWSESQGSRHDHLVARLCGAGVWAVRSCRARRASGNWDILQRGGAGSRSQAPGARPDSGAVEDDLMLEESLERDEISKPRDATGVQGFARGKLRFQSKDSHCIGSWQAPAMADCAQCPRLLVSQLARADDVGRSGVLFSSKL